MNGFPMNAAAPSGRRGDPWESGALPALPRLRLGCWPTPVHPLPALSRATGGELWVKREDQSAPRLGGNKVRKLELLLAAALEAGATTVLTAGAVGSHHVATTAWYAHQVGLACHALGFPQALTLERRRWLALAWRLGATLQPCGDRLALALALPAARLRLGRKGYLIGPGGSSPLGTLGYVAAGLELGDQVAAGLLPEPATIVVALGSGGTLAGLAIGTALAGLGSHLVGVRVVERPLCNETLTQTLVERTRLLLARLGRPVPRVASLRIEHGQAGPGYGSPTAAALRACRSARDHEGLRLEPTYTGKALAALLEGTTASQAELRRGPVLFVNTHNSRCLTPLIRELPTRPGLPPASLWMR